MPVVHFTQVCKTMPSGKTHDVIGAVAAVTISASAYTLISLATDPITPIVPSTMLFTGIVLGTRFFSPDLDGQTNNLRRWGIFAPIWSMYASYVPHRGKASHTYIQGFLIRLAYITGALLIALAVIQFVTTLPTLIYFWHTVIFLIWYQPYFLIGVFISHVVHIQADYSVSAFKRLRRRRRQK